MPPNQQSLFPEEANRMRRGQPVTVWRLVTTPVRWLHRGASKAAPWLGILFFIVPGVQNRNRLGYAYAWFVMLFVLAAVAVAIVQPGLRQ